MARTEKKTDGTTQPRLRTNPVVDYLRQRLGATESEAELADSLEGEFRSSISVTSLRRVFSRLADINNLGLPALGELVTRVPLDPSTPATVDVLVPAGPGPHPVLVYIHGGAWIAGSPASHRKLTARFAQAGYLVVSVDYRLAPEYPFPAGLDDCIAAVRWAARNVAEFGGDPDRLAIGGDSAGANLAAATVHCLRGSRGAPKIRAALLIYGVYDMRDMGSPAANRFLHEAYLPGRLSEDLDDPRISPLSVAHHLPPSFVVVGSQDVLAPQSRLLRDRLMTAGTPHVYLEERGMPHAFMQMEFMGRVRGIVAEMSEFLQGHLSATPDPRLRTRLWQSVGYRLERLLARRALRGRLIHARNGRPRGPTR